MISLNALAAQEHRNDLARAAGHRHVFGEDQLAAQLDGTLALRLAHPDEAPIVHRLAQLDDAEDLTGEVLLALLDGEAIAALSLRDGRVVADPFHRTEAAVAVLRLRAGERAGKGSRRGLRAILRPRFA